MRKSQLRVRRLAARPQVPSSALRPRFSLVTVVFQQKTRTESTPDNLLAIAVCDSTDESSVWARPCHPL